MVILQVPLEAGGILLRIGADAIQLVEHAVLECHISSRPVSSPDGRRAEPCCITGAERRARASLYQTMTDSPNGERTQRLRRNC